ncbi:AAA family ATPase [Acidihalobacter prosperus]|uniref:Transposase n=1 Tax=Acidihalobacter prosperus TaxID=160660 RepID=A0A1A6C8C4_9GAMM|nr:ATP-binding protein [Acidihalobacter prosperus]OBS10818.1 transposase [Acidihalobacter prosperus]
MKHQIVPVKNISRLSNAANALLQRTPGMPGMGLVHAPTGYGKTTACTWLVNQVNGVYVRALALWSPKTMLEAIARELDIELHGMTLAGMLERIIQRLAETNRPVFIDEADYVVQSKRLTDSLRDLHDMSMTPVILIGMHGIERRIRSNPQFTGRLSQWVEFEGLDVEDAILLRDSLIEVEVEDDLLQVIYRAASTRNSGAEARRLVVGLSQVEGYARQRGMDRIGVADWPKGRDFFLGMPALGGV